MKIKVSLLFLALASAISASAVASDEMLLPEAKTEVKAEASATIIDPSKSLKYSMDYADKQNDLNLLQIDLKALQVKSQIELIEKDKKKELENKLLDVERKKWEQERISLIEKHQEELKSKDQALSKIKTQKLGDKKVAKKLSIKDRVFVTRIAGIGQNLSARIYVDNNVRTVKTGDLVIEGVKVKEISLHSVIFDINGTDKMVPITTADKAYYKTLESQQKTSSMSTDPMDLSGLPPGLKY
jgi:hypothetical protein